MIINVSCILTRVIVLESSGVRSLLLHFLSLNPFFLPFVGCVTLCKVLSFSMFHP